MEEQTKNRTARTLAESIESYGAAMVSSAEAKGDDGAEPRVLVRMKDGLAFNLPWDFNVEHLDAVFAIAAAARIKGREEAGLEGFDGTAH